MEAAFFDLDKTVIAKASMVAFSGPLHRAGMLTRRTLLRAAWASSSTPSSAPPVKLAKLRDSVLRLTVGWIRPRSARSCAKRWSMSSSRSCTTRRSS